jgi:hypothetical protein
VKRPSNAVLLGQTEFWYDGSGERHRISEMSLQYCSNLRDYLLRSAPRIAEGMYHKMLGIPAPRGDVAGDDYDSILEELADASSSSEQGSAWIRRQALIGALEERIRDLGGTENGDTREVTVVIRMKVPNVDGAGVVGRTLERTLRRLPYEHEIIPDG